MRCIFHWATLTVWRLWISQRVTLDWRILSRVWCLFLPTFRLTVVPVCGCFLEFCQLSETRRMSPGCKSFFFKHVTSSFSVKFWSFACTVQWYFPSGITCSFGVCFRQSCCTNQRRLSCALYLSQLFYAWCILLQEYLEWISRRQNDNSGHTLDGRGLINSLESSHSDTSLTRKSTNIWKKELAENRGWSLYSALYVGCFCPAFPGFEAFFPYVIPRRLTNNVNKSFTPKHMFALLLT